MKTFITQTLLISCLSLSMAYARDQHAPPISEEHKAAFAECAEEAGMPDRESGERPTKEQHEAFKTCLEGKGIKPRKGGRPGGPPPEFRSESATDE